MKYKLIAVSTLLAIQATVAFGALEPLPDAGLTPDSPFYFVKAWTEQIQSFFTFGSENKARQFLHLAEVRLAEFKKMSEAKKDYLAQKTLDKFNTHIDRVSEKVSDMKKDMEDTADIEKRIEEARMKHIEVLGENLLKVPEQAREGLSRALERSRKALELGRAENELEDESEDPEGDEFIFKISEQNDSGMSGVAMLEAEDGKTKVKIRLVGAPAGVAQPSHIHIGSCPNVGAVKYPLTALMNGRSETLLDVSIDALRAELPLGLNVHKSAAEAGVYVACGNLEL